MNKYQLKGNITDEDFMMNVLNNLPKEYNIILNELENCLTLSRDVAFTIEIISKILNQWFKKIENKNEKKREPHIYR